MDAFTSVVEHWRHQGFRPESSVVDLTIGFTCTCTEPEVHTMYKLRDIKLAMSEGDERADFLVYLTEMRNLDASGFRLLQGSRFDETSVHAALMACRRVREEYLLRTNGEEIEAAKKAETLLLQYLSENQTEEYTKHGIFHTTGQDGLQYRIELASCRNIVRVKNGIDEERFCIVPKGTHMPAPDLMLAMKLMLELSQEDFFKIANRELVGKPTRQFRTFYDPDPAVSMLRETRYRLENARIPYQANTDNRIVAMNDVGEPPWVTTPLTV